MNTGAVPYKPMNTLLFVLGIVLLIGLVFPLAFLYIEDNVSLRILMHEFWMTPVRLLFITLMIYGIIMLGNRLSGRHQNHWLRHALQLIIIMPAMYGILYGFLVWVDFPLHCPECRPDPNSFQQRRYYGLYFFGTLFLYTFISGLNFYRMAEQKAAEAEQLQEQCAGVCLQALKTQVNPHFLFNSLSVLSELVTKDAQRSEQFIHHLGKAYRYILEQKEMELVTLQEELEFLDAYFFLLQIRFGNKIRLEKDVSPGSLQHRLPPLTLQLLIENAVKHNKMSGSEPLTIGLRTGKNELVVTNPIRRREPAGHSTGIGLENIRLRLAHFTDKQVIVIGQHHTFSVTIPLVAPADPNERP